MFQKYFIAIVPPEPLLSEIQAIKQSIFESYQTKGALRSPGHITLHMPFSFEEDKENKLISCLREFQFNEPFTISLNNYGCFEPRVVFINVIDQPELSELQKQLVTHVKKKLNLFNQSDDMRGFHPHVTVAFRDLKKPVFYKLWEQYRSKTFTATFNCVSLALLKHVNDRWIVLKDFPEKHK
ncbi:MAG: 2'-5' RNA ligase family protein [Bacteroidota bacterium]